MNIIDFYFVSLNRYLLKMLTLNSYSENYWTFRFHSPSVQYFKIFLPVTRYILSNVKLNQLCTSFEFISLEASSCDKLDHTYTKSYISENDLAFAFVQYLLLEKFYTLDKVCVVSLFLNNSIYFFTQESLLI